MKLRVEKSFAAENGEEGWRAIHQGWILDSEDGVNFTTEDDKWVGTFTLTQEEIKENTTTQLLTDFQLAKQNVLYFASHFYIGGGDTDELEADFKQKLEDLIELARNDEY